MMMMLMMMVVIMMMVTVLIMMTMLMLMVMLMFMMMVMMTMTFLSALTSAVPERYVGASINFRLMGTSGGVDPEGHSLTGFGLWTEWGSATARTWVHD